MKSIEELRDRALDAMKHSNVKNKSQTVGAAVICSSGKIFSGCSFEGCPMDYCAERVALLKAISEGERVIGILVTYDGKIDTEVVCGVCLNALYQLCGRKMDLPIYFWPSDEDTYKEVKLGDVYPMAF